MSSCQQRRGSSAAALLSSCRRAWAASRLRCRCPSNAAIKSSSSGGHDRSARCPKKKAQTTKSAAGGLPPWDDKHKSRQQAMQQRASCCRPPAGCRRTRVVEQAGEEGRPELPRPVPLEGQGRPQGDGACRRWGGPAGTAHHEPSSPRRPQLRRSTTIRAAASYASTLRLKASPRMPSQRFCSNKVRTCGGVPHPLNLQVPPHQQAVRGGGGAVRVCLPRPGPPLPHLHAAEGVGTGVALHGVERTVKKNGGWSAAESGRGGGKVGRSAVGFEARPARAQVGHTKQGSLGRPEERQKSGKQAAQHAAATTVASVPARQRGSCRPSAPAAPPRAAAAPSPVPAQSRSAAVQGRAPLQPRPLQAMAAGATHRQARYQKQRAGCIVGGGCTHQRPRPPPAR